MNQNVYIFLKTQSFLFLSSVLIEVNYNGKYLIFKLLNKSNF